MNETSRVSVIIPNLNCGRFLGNAIESCLLQTVKPDEIIIVDGGSTDDSLKIAADYPEVKWLKQEVPPLIDGYEYRNPMGLPKNQGIAVAEGKFIICLDADDWLEPTYVEECLNAMKDPKVGIVSTGVQCFGDTTERWNPPIGLTLTDMIAANRIFTCSMFRKEAWEQAGRFAEDWCFEDWDLWIRIMAVGWKLAVVREPLFHYNVRGDSRTKRMTAAEVKTLSEQIRLKYAHMEVSNASKAVRAAEVPKVKGTAVYVGPGIEGWMDSAELDWLYQTAMKMQSVVEIGSWKGRSTHALCSGCQGTVTAVDHFRGPKGNHLLQHDAKDDAVYKEFCRNTSQFANLAAALRMDSVEAAALFEDGGVDMVFIDAAHTEEEIRADIKAWLPKARRIICGHDYSKNFPGVCKVVDEEIGVVNHAGTIWWKEIQHTGVEWKEVNSLTSQIKADTEAILGLPEVAKSVFAQKSDLVTEVVEVGDLKIHIARGRNDRNVIDEVIVRDTYHLEQLAKILPAPRSIVDVGGHIGTFGLKALSLWSDAVLAAYEPNEVSADLYLRNAVENGDRDVEVFTQAVSYEPHKTLLAEHVGVASGGGILTDEVGIPSLPGKREVSYRDVEQVTLEDVLEVQGLNGFECIDLLKLDCEGSEVEMFRQMEQETADRIGFIVGEYHFNGKYKGFKELVRAKFPHFGVMCMGNPESTIGTFAAGPPELILKFHEAIHAKPCNAVRTNDAGLLPLTTPLRNSITLTFTDGPCVRIDGDVPADYSVYFDNLDTGENVYTRVIKPGQWASPNPKYFIRWRAMVEENGEQVLEHFFDPEDKRVLIELTSKALGDTVAWMPYAEEFRKIHNCRVDVTTFWPELLKDAYPDIKFLRPGAGNLDEYYACYRVGSFDNDYNRNPVNWRVIPLQQTAADILGIEYKEIRPMVVAPIELPRPTNKKYVAISEHTTHRGKHWLHPNGWQTVVDYLRSHGYEVASVSKEPTALRNVIKRNGRTIAETVANIRSADLYVGLAAGPAWLAYALHIPSVVIGGFTETYSEPKEFYRVTPPNANICHGCYNDLKYPFSRDNQWCPAGKNWECSTSITPEMVIAAIERALTDRNSDETKYAQERAGIPIYAEFERNVVTMDEYDPDPAEQVTSGDVVKGSAIYLDDLGKDFPKQLKRDAEAVAEACRDAMTSLDSMRVLMIVPHLSTGGLPQYTLRSVEELLACGAKVEVVEWNFLSPDYVIQRNKLRAICTVHAFKPNEAVADKYKKLEDIVGKFRPDVVHLQEFPESFLSQASMDGIYRANRSYKIVETSHDSGFDMERKHVWPEYFVHVCEWIQQRVDRAMAGRVHLVEGSSIVEYVPSVRRHGRAEALKALQLDARRLHVLNVGLWTRNKNQGEVIEVARTLPGVQFHFVGNQAPNFAEYWKPLMEDLPKNCKVWGEREEVDLFYAGMDALLFTSKSELAPIVVREALAHGMPVLMRDLPFYTDAYDHNPLVTYIPWDVDDINLTDGKATEEILREKLLPMGHGLMKAYERLMVPVAKNGDDGVGVESINQYADATEMRIS